MSDRRHVKRLTAVVLVAIGLCLPGYARATQKFGPLEISGNLQSQNLMRMQDASNYQYIQNRNTAHLRLDYDWLQGGKFMNNYDIPFIQSSKLFVLWRGVYDSVYDTLPQIGQKEDIHGKAYGGQHVWDFAHQLKTPHGTLSRQLFLDSLTTNERDAFKFDNQLRELYVDLKLRQIPLTVRAGKQQIVWGETDNFRMLDRANSLDLTWHFQQEIPPPAFGWDEIRQTFWMFKFLYDLGDVFGTSQNFLEWYWNPGDWAPAKQAFFPRPWGLPFLNPLTNPIDGAFTAGPCLDSAGKQLCQRLIGGSKIFKQGTYTRNPLENSQVGVRYHAILPAGIETGLVYFYQRWAGDDGTNYAPLKGVPSSGNSAQDVAALQRFVNKGEFPAEAYAPYVHSIGLSANYSDEQYTQAVFRLETIYDMGVPFFDTTKVTLFDNPALPGITKKDMWKGMFAFDRPTWIRWLNKKSTWFLTGQFFWHHLLNNPDCRATVNGREVEGAQNIAQLPSSVRRTVPSCLVGGLDLPSSQRPQSVAFRDKIRGWEALFTLAAFSFYRGGSIVPVLGMAVDPVNSWNMEAFWSVDYLVRNDMVVNVGQKYFITPVGHSSPIFETWGLAGLNNGRSETSIRLTYQF
ncbi:MAG TPA: DUF1302 family protein [Candidatus Eisenbacteria bacterium]|nr:DUF1302 family protein [Candidatus Eisenbacteria bacterium]